MAKAKTTTKKVPKARPKPAPVPTETSAAEEAPPSPAAAVLAVQPDAPKPLVAAPVEEKLVRVRPRRTIPRFRVGPKWYSVTQNVNVDLPPHVVRHLEERGIV